MNLKQQLRGHAKAFTPDGPIHDYINEAADRIEALEAALREVVGHLEVDESDAALVIAGDALGEATNDA